MTGHGRESSIGIVSDLAVLDPLQSIDFAQS